MAKNILVISTDLTGHGHKSIAEALSEQFEDYNSSVNINVIDGFILSGIVGKAMGNIYSPLVKYTPALWKLYYTLVYMFPGLTNSFTCLNFKKEFMNTIYRVKPDLIITLHSAFVGSVIDLLEVAKMDIPVITVIADITSITRLWTDKRSVFTICPTIEAEEKVKKFGVPRDSIKCFGFPVRKRFYNHNIELSHINKDSYMSRKLKFLIINGSEKTRNIEKILHSILLSFHCEVAVICGRDERLYKRLTKEFCKQNYADLNILGYVANIQEYMFNNDFLITRGSPNIIMEAVNCCIPIVMCGSLPGQEEENPDFVINNGLGILCSDINAIASNVEKLLENDFKGVIDIRKNQYNFRNLNASKDMVEFIVSQMEGQPLNALG